MDFGENKRLRKRLMIAAYIVFLVVAIILILISPNFNDLGRSIVINLATEFIGAVILFFGLRYVFLVDDWDMVDKLLMSLRDLLTPSAKRFFLEKIPNPTDFRSHIRKSHHVDMCGVTLSDILHKTLDVLKTSLASSNIRLRILILEPSNEAIRFAVLRSGHEGPGRYPEYYKQNLTLAVQILSPLVRKYASRLQVRFLPFPSSFGMLKFEKEEESIFFVEIYPHGVGLYNPPYFIVKQGQDPEWFQYFEEQFEYMWSIARSWESIIKVEKGGNE